MKQNRWIRPAVLAGAAVLAGFITWQSVERRRVLRKKQSVQVLDDAYRKHSDVEEECRDE